MRIFFSLSFIPFKDRWDQLTQFFDFAINGFGHCFFREIALLFSKLF